MSEKKQAIAVSDEIHRAFSKYCRDNNLKMSGMLNWILREWLNKQINDK